MSQYQQVALLVFLLFISYGSSLVRSAPNNNNNLDHKKHTSLSSVPCPLTNVNISPSDESCLLGHMLQILTRLVNNQRQPFEFGDSLKVEEAPVHKQANEQSNEACRKVIEEIAKNANVCLSNIATTTTTTTTPSSSTVETISTTEEPYDDDDADVTSTTTESEISTEQVTDNISTSTTTTNETASTTTETASTTTETASTTTTEIPETTPELTTEIQFVTELPDVQVPPSDSLTEEEPKLLFIPAIQFVDRIDILSRAELQEYFKKLVLT